MYDFRTPEEREAAAAPDLAKPPALLTAAEVVRAAVEFPSSWVLDTVVPARDEGDGRPVLVIPGFYGTDGLTGRLRGHLRRHGYHVHGWRLGRNVGLTDRLIDGLADRFAEIHARHGQPVSVVGWSFGGLLARWLAHQRPADVRQVLCLGSPWRAEGERTRSTAMFERARATHGLSERARPMVEHLRGPVPVFTTAVWSKTDGVVSWRGCLVDEGPLSENIHVPSSHVGLVANPFALAVVADRLRQDPLAPEPFAWSRCLRESLVGARSAVGATS